MAAHSESLAPTKRLDSWKEIAAFFGKDERTVKRWEKERGLPVRRVPGAAGGTVFAYADELERWLAGTNDSPAARVADSLPPDEVPQGEFKSEFTARTAALAPAASGTVNSLPKAAEEAAAPIELGPETLRRSRRHLRFWAIAVPAVAGFLIYSSIGHREMRFNKTLAARHQPDSVAQDLYLKGRFYFE